MSDPGFNSNEMHKRRATDELFPTLGSICSKWRTDKAVNGYTDLYECLFWRTRRDVSTVLEIGIGTMIPGAPSSMVGFALEGYQPGGSLRAWRDFFPNAMIYGIDIQPDTQFLDERIVTLLCDSTDVYQVQNQMRDLNYIEFDLIVDDGSHVLDNQLRTLTNFYPFLKVGGIYVIEDIAHNGLAKQTEKIRRLCPNSAYFAAGQAQNPLVLTKRRPNPSLSEMIEDPQRIAWVSAETNKALRSRHAVEEARLATITARLPLHPDSQKAWDNFLALFHTAANTQRDAPVLDAGAGRESAYLPSLRKMGYTDLTGMNLIEPGVEMVNGICYRFGDITKTSFSEKYLSFVACLSAIQCGISCKSFIDEMARVLRPGGHLFISTDYWHESIDVGDRHAFGVPLKIFTPSELADLVEYASNVGLTLVGELDWKCQETVVDCFDLHYTFFNLLFRREASRPTGFGS